MWFFTLTEKLYLVCEFLLWIFTLTENLYLVCEFLLWFFTLTENLYFDWEFLLWFIILTDNLYFYYKIFIFYCKVFYLKIINFHGPSGILRHNCARQPMYLIVVICATPKWNVIQCVHMDKIRKSRMPHKIIGIEIEWGRSHYAAQYTNVQVYLI